MPPLRYRVLSWEDPVGTGVSRSRFLNLNGVAKRNNDGEPRIVALEFICAHLARAILLPTPPGFLVQDPDEEGTSWFVSLDFNVSGEKLPPADPPALVKAHPRLSWGIVLFDMWVLNGDRHQGNLAYNKDTGAVGVFDHSRAIAPQKVDVEKHLSAKAGDHGIPKQCLAPHLTSRAGIGEWEERIRAVPEWYIREIVRRAGSIGLDAGDTKRVADFLLERRCRLKELLEKHQGRFPKLEPELPLDEATSNSPATPNREAVDVAEDAGGIPDDQGPTGQEAEAS